MMMLPVAVEATPQLVTDRLRQWASERKDIRFPYVVDAMVVLRPETMAAIGAVEGMPVMVVAAPERCPQGLLAFCREDGSVQTFWASPQQVQGLA